MIHLKYGISLKTLLVAKKMKLKKLSYFRHIMRRQDPWKRQSYWGKAKAAGRGSPNTSWTDSIREAEGLSLQELSRAGEDRTLGTSLIRKSPGVGAKSMACNTHM